MSKSISEITFKSFASCSQGMPSCNAQDSGNLAKTLLILSLPPVTRDFYAVRAAGEVSPHNLPTTMWGVEDTK